MKLKSNRNKLKVFFALLISTNLVGQTPPPLGYTSSFAIFTSVGAVSNTGFSHVTGNFGTNAGAVTGFGNVNGNMHIADTLTAQSVIDLNVAYNNLNAQTPGVNHALTLGGGEVLTPNVYLLAGASTCTGTITLDGGGNPNACFVFQIGGAFAAAAASRVVLTNGAQACNVFWSINGATAFAANSIFKGTIIVNGALSLAVGCQIEGRLFSVTGAIAVSGIIAGTPIGCGSPILTGPLAPNMGATSCFALLTSSGTVTNAGTTNVQGDIGTNNSTVTGFDPAFVTGVIHSFPDAITANSSSDLNTLYNYLNSLPVDIELLYPAQFGFSQVLTPHVYVMSAATVLTDTIFLDSRNVIGAIFVIRIMGALTTSTNPKVVLRGGTNSNNVFWQVEGAVTIGNGANFNGVIVAHNSAIILNAGSTFKGNGFSTNGNITTQDATIKAKTDKISNQSGNWSNASVWSPYGIPCLCENVTIANTHNIVIDLNASCGNLKVGQGMAATLQFGTSTYVLTTLDSVFINTNATLNLGANNDTLYMKGNFINNGNFITQNGTVKLNGASNQVIGGTMSTALYNLVIAPATGGGVAVNKALTISNLLILNGTNPFTLTTNNKISLLSFIGQSAYIDKITAPNNVTITGDIAMQRYMASVFTGWSMMGSPGIVGKNFTQWNNAFAITCAACPNGYNVGGVNFGSVQKYNEIVGGNYDNSLRYIEIGNTTDPMTIGQGFWVYRGTSNPGTLSSALTINVSGQVQKGSNSFIITTTGANNADHGWNLLANPYPAPISWFKLRNGNINLNDEVSVYNPNLNGGSGAYAQYTGGVSNPSLNSGGIDDNIPLGQAFYVHTSGVAPSSFSLNYDEDMKTTSQNPLRRPESSLVQTVFRLAIKGPNNWYDETAFHFNSNATNVFDADYDAYKLNSFDTQAPNLSSLINGAQYGINGLPALTGLGTTTIPILALAGTTGNYTINPIDIANFPVNACVTLHDNFTNSDHDLRLGSYSCILFDTTITSRFNLNIIFLDSVQQCFASTGINNLVKNTPINECAIILQRESNSACLKFNFATAERVSINVYDVSGKKVVESIFAGVKTDQVKLNLTNLSSGMYLIRVESLTCTFTEKIIL